MSKDFRNIGVVSVATGLSRVLGLVRDICFFAYLGAGLWASAFVLAFTLPNLFRRLLGEGALSAALIPVFSDVLEKEGRPKAFRFFNQVFTRLALFLIVLAVVLAGGSLVFSQLGTIEEGRWSTALSLGVVVFPYVLFVCLAAVVAAALNACGRFAAAALSPVWLNLAMIAALIGAGFFFPGEPGKIVWVLCVGVLGGGILQLALPAWDLWKTGWKPRVERSGSKALSRVWVLFLPGVLGAAILQVNILISRVIAYGLDEAAASVLYLASRLMELPLGLFIVAVATVVFPTMSKAVARGDTAGFEVAFRQGVRMILAISIAAGVGLAVLAEPILTVLFQYGAFDAAAVSETAPVVIIYALGLVFYSLATFATRGLHAHADMRAPVRVAAVCLVVNVILSLVLMRPLGVNGLALANVLAAALQMVLLWRALRRHRGGGEVGVLLKPLMQVVVASVCMVITCAAWLWLCGWHVDGVRLRAFAAVLGGVPLGIGVFATVLWQVRFEETGTLISLIKRRFARF